MTPYNEYKKKVRDSFTDRFSDGMTPPKDILEDFIIPTLDNLLVEVEGSLEWLERMKLAWDDVAKDGNPNETVKTQIFGFMQAYDVTKKALARFKGEEV